MYQIYADNELIYDSTIENYKIGKGEVTIELNKSGSFVFSVYPDHFYFDRFIKLKTVITVYKSNMIIFRGRILNDVIDYWNNKVITCEGELGFLQDSIIRPFDFNGTPADLFKKFIQDHNSQVDDFKKFKIGVITVEDPNNYIARSNSEYESALTNINSRLIEDSLGGYVFITHGEDGRDEIPTINYLADFTEISKQEIKFGENLKDYTKTVKADDIATAIIPLGKEVEDEDESTENKRLTIADINGGIDYVYSEEGVALYGWIFKTVIWDDVTIADNLKSKAIKYLENAIEQHITIELNAIDLHLLDASIESISAGKYVRVTSEPHNLAYTLLCHKQTLDLLRPDNDSITLGHSYYSLTESTVKKSKEATGIDGIKSTVVNLSNKTNTLVKETERLEEVITGYVDPEAKLPALMAQSFGVFQTVEVLSDGSSIYYLHNKPKLADSSTIWKLTGDAYAVSTDGGATWNAGIDSNGNTLVNILSSVGVIADWIKIGGTSDGVLDVKDSTGATIVRLDKDGITLADGASLISKSGVCGDMTFISNGGSPEWLGFRPDSIADGSAEKATLIVAVDIPENFVIKSATLRVIINSTNGYYYYPEGGMTNFSGYPRKVKAYVGDWSMCRNYHYPGSYYDIVRDSGEQIVSGLFSSDGYTLHFQGDYKNYIVNSYDIADMFKSGLNMVQIIADDLYTENELDYLQYTGTAVAIVTIKGYTKN